MEKMGNMSLEHDEPVTPKRSSWKGVVSVAIIIILIAALFLAKNQGWLGPLAGAGTPNPKSYQAVFLTNGQVYFGKLKSVGGDDMILRDIYYLQVVQPLQQKEPAEAQQRKEPALNLVKMGSEIHGPADTMIIPKTSVIFWEDIKNDGTVAKAIAEFKTRKN